MRRRRPWVIALAQWLRRTHPDATSAERWAILREHDEIEVTTAAGARYVVSVERDAAGRERLVGEPLEIPREPGPTRRVFCERYLPTL